MAAGPYLVTRGIVLRDTDTRDADKILTLLTAEQGKIAVIARGARRKGCKFAACAQPLAYSGVDAPQKGQWYYANEGSTIELFNGLRSELDAMALGFYLAELTEGVITEESPQQELLSLLLNGLYAISTLHKPLPLVKAAFECRLLCLAGYEPLADACAYCGRPEPEQPCFDVLQGVLHCRGCGERGGQSFPLCRDSLAALRHIVYGDPKRLYSFTLGADAQKRLSAAAEAFVSAQLGGGSKRWIFIRACAVWCQNRIQNVIYTTFNTFRSEHERII